ncbi:MAG: hypothetical protein QOI38_1034 [Sphingomonadales bacterium]|jgi:tetratricopeptide (TPR) repeat protein|nr:hypothetical protein [Sphingomonadales bacterium]
MAEPSGAFDPSQTRAVVVGVESYAAGRSWDLNGPANDAVRFASFLVDHGVPPASIRCYLSALDRADKKTVLDRIPAVCATWEEPTEAALTRYFYDDLMNEPCDTLVIYWSGHGVVADREQRHHLFTSDARKDTERNVNLTSLVASLRSKRRYPHIGRLVVFVDACANHVAQAYRGMPRHDFPSPSGNLRDAYVFSAASAGEYARNINIEQTGLFTRELMKVLGETGWPPDFEVVFSGLQRRFRVLESERVRQTPSLIWFRAPQRPEYFGVLPDRDRRDAFFSRLGVFEGGFSFLACRAVASEFSTLVTDIYLRELIKSGVVLQDDAKPHRYRLTDDARGAALERLELLGEAETARELHARYFAELAARHEDVLKSPSRGGSMALLEPEVANFSAALEWCAKSPRNVDSGLGLAGALGWFWILNGDFGRGRRQFASVLEAEVWDRATPARAKALYADGALAFMEGEYSDAETRLKEAVERLERGPDDMAGKRLRGYALTVLGRVTPDLKLGLKYVARACRLFVDAKDEWGRALALNDHGYVLVRSGKWRAASECLAQSVAIWQRLGDDWGHPLALNNLGMVDAQEVADEPRDLQKARKSHEEALSLYLNRGNHWGVAESLKFLGEVELESENFEVALGCFRESLARLKIEPRPQLEVDCMLGLARLLYTRISAQPDTETPLVAVQLLSKWFSETNRLKLISPPHHERQARFLETQLRQLLRERYETHSKLGRDSDRHVLIERALA